MKMKNEMIKWEIMSNVCVWCVSLAGFSNDDDAAYLFFDCRKTQIFVCLISRIPGFFNDAVLVWKSKKN